MGFWQKFAHTHCNKIVGDARKGDLTLEGLPMPEEMRAEVAYQKFQLNWDTEAKATNGKPGLKKVLWKTFGLDLMLAGLFKLGWSVCVIMGAFFFVRSILSHVKENPGPFYSTEAGWILTAFFFLDAYLIGMFLQRMGYGCMTVGIRIRAALISAVCDKSFKLASINRDAASDVVSFVASDIAKIFDGCMEIHYLWTAPIEAGAILIILAVLVKEYALPGWGVICIVLPMQYLFGWMIIKNKGKNAKNTQERGGMMQELLPAMKLVKYYAWEQFFEQKVSAIRKSEIHFHTKNAIIKTINFALVFGTPPLTALVIFAAYEMSVGKLPSVFAFTCLSLFNILRFPLVVLPKAMRAASEAIHSIARVEEYLHMDVATKGIRSGAPGASLRNAQLKHHAEGDFTLNVPEFNVRPGELVGVVGRVGAGKTSLIQAILGNMALKKGECSSGGKISYVPQDPWCQNLSIKDNITFGMPLDEERYAQVIQDCALELDLQILPMADDTKAGLRGINLSGGQRQRVNVARAAYFNGDLVLLDNALSALDHHTAHHIFKALLKETMKDKAIVLITHQVEFLPQCDKVAIMDAGNCIYFGPYNAQAQSVLSKILPASHLLAAAGGAEQPREAKPKAPKAARSTSGQLNMAATNLSDNMDKKKAAAPTSLDMNKAMNAYIVAGSVILFPLSIIIFMLTQTCRQFSDFWVRQWTSENVWVEPEDKWYKNGVSGPLSAMEPGEAKVLVYALLVIAFILLMLLRGTVFHWWALRASQNLHRRAMHNVLHAPLGFFLQNPVGELLLAFTKDQDVLDESIVDSLHYLGIYGLIMLATIITVSVTIKLFSIFGGILIIVTFSMLWFYLPAATKLKKLKAETGGALVGLVAETLEGLNVVNAYDHNAHFINEARERMNQFHTALYCGETLNLWLAFYCDMYGALLVLIVCIFAMTQREELGPAAVGLAFSNTLQMLIFYTWSVRFIAETISLFGSAEKIGWLAGPLPQEGDALHNDDAHLDAEHGRGSKAIVSVSSGNVPASWPKSGVIEFKNVWMKYAPTAPFALKGVTFKLEHGEKAGVVGRTGSGKSTLLLALYRMFNLEKGTISVDGRDAAGMQLRKLRPALSIIPQEPLVFSGSVRENMDPFCEFPDNELWEVIKRVGLEEPIKAAGGLDGHLDGSGGKSWSLGQKQLMCLARAALRRVPILCLDEATAAMDPHTEQQVQAIIKKIFSDRTTLTIAHRLDTVIESDKVLVMEQGVLKEFAAPKQLLDDRDSMFSLLVDKSGAQAAALLREMANEHFAKVGQH